MGYRIQNRRDTADRWAEMNPILLEGEIGLVTDNANQYKVGDGIHAWNDLPLRGYNGTITQDTGYDENAVMSQKATTEKLSELGSEIGINNAMKLSNGGAIFGDSITASSAYVYSDFIPVKKGDVIKFRTTGGSSSYISAGYSSDNIPSFIPNSTANFKGTNKNYSDSIVEVEFIVDADTKYILISANLSILKKDTVDFIQISDESIQGNINKLSQIVNLQTGISKSIQIKHEGLLGGNNIPASSAYFYSDFISVNEGDIIRFKTAGSPSYYVCAGYSDSSLSSFLLSSSANIKGVSGSDSNPIFDVEIVIDANTKYIVIGCDGRVIDNKTDISVVSKGSLREDVDNLKKSNNLDIKIPIIVGKFTNIYGQEVNSAAYGKSNKIEVFFGQVVKFKSSGGSSALSVVAYNGNNINLGKSLSFLRDGTLEDIIYYVPKDITHIEIQADIRVVTSASILANIRDASEKNSISCCNQSIYSIRERKAFVAWVMDCGAYCFTPNTLEYMQRLKDYGFNKSSYAILPNTIGTASVDYYIDRFMNNGNEIALHSDGRIYQNNTEESFNDLMQIYMTEMASVGSYPNGYISLSGLDVPSLDVLKKYCSWGHSGPKNYGLYENDYENGLNTILTIPYHLNRLNVEETIEQRTNGASEIIVSRAKEMIDKAISNNGYLVFYTHSYKETELPGVPYTLYEDVFIEILEYIKEKHDKGLLDIGCMEDIMGGYYQKRYNEYPYK